MNRILHPIEPEELMAYMDGELTADRVAATSAHLDECAECQGLVGELRSASQTLKTWRVDSPESAIPPAITRLLAENKLPLRNSIPVRSTLREFMVSRWPAVVWVGTVAAVLLISFGIVRFQGGKTHMVFSQVGAQIADGGRDHLKASAPAPPPPPPAPVNGRNFSEFVQLSPGLQSDESRVGNNLPEGGPMIIRTAELSLVTKEFDKARANLEAILRRHRGFIGELNAGGSTGSGRTLTAKLRVPADQLDATLAEVKALGRVESESQSGQDVTSQYVDLQARLGNARNTEQRLTDLLRNRTGKLSDVLQVEQEVSRVRGEIEQIEAERKTMANQVSYATLSATLTEDYKAELQVVPPSTSTRLGNAAIEGYRSMADGIVGLALFLLSIGPSLLLWGAILFFPARVVWRRVRRSLAA